MTFMQARTANEVLKAQERRLRLQQMKGELVDRAKAVAQVFRLARDERDAWINWPARVAAMIAAEVEVDPHQVHTVVIALSAALTWRVSIKIAGSPPSSNPRAARAGLQPEARDPQAALCKPRDQGLALARHLGFANDLSGRIDHAHAAPFQRDVDRGIVLHGCLSSSMLGADHRTPFHLSVGDSRHSEKAQAAGRPDYRIWQFSGSQALDEAYVPFFGAFGAACFAQRSLSPATSIEINLSGFGIRILDHEEWRATRAAPLQVLSIPGLVDRIPGSTRFAVVFRHNSNGGQLSFIG
jgi:hypothetical protein